jgi:hypothetical protein
MVSSDRAAEPLAVCASGDRVFAWFPVYGELSQRWRYGRLGVRCRATGAEHLPRRGFRNRRGRIPPVRPLLVPWCLQPGRGMASWARGKLYIRRYPDLLARDVETIPARGLRYRGGRARTRPSASGGQQVVSFQGCGGLGRGWQCGGRNSDFRSSALRIRRASFSIQGGFFYGSAPAPGAQVFISFSPVRRSGPGASSLPESGSFGRE